MREFIYIVVREHCSLRQRLRIKWREHCYRSFRGGESNGIFRSIKSRTLLLGCKVKAATVRKTQACVIKTTSWFIHLTLWSVASLIPHTILFSCLLAVINWLFKRIRTTAKELNDSEHDVITEAVGVKNGAISKFMALMALMTVFLDKSWADSWYSNLMKFRTVTEILCTRENGVITEAGITEEIGEFIEISLADNSDRKLQVKARETFEGWLRNALLYGQIGGLPQTGGEYIEMTKDSMCDVVTRIIGSEHREFLVQGAVGCGKSTRFPEMLSRHGRLLICEPTRALATNIEGGLRTVCDVDATLRIRNGHKFGSSGITICTYGYALHWLANNPKELETFRFIQFDEVHVNDANAIVLYNWLKSRYQDKFIIKTTATPPSKHVELRSQMGIETVSVKALTIDSFIDQQGSKQAYDVTQKGRSILIFLASYNEIDQMGHKLRSKGYTVIKADGRTLRKATNLQDQIQQAQGETIFVLATNAIENGVTLDVDVVVDFGLKVNPSLNESDRALTVEKVPVTRGERIQRMGRVGRFKKGFCLQIGSLGSNEINIPQTVVVDAALISFAYNVHPYIENLASDSFKLVTSKQVRAASQCELPLAFVVNYVNPDGSIPRAVFAHIKPLLLRDTAVDVTATFHSSVFSNGWLTVGQYKRAQLLKDDEVDSSLDGFPLPFLCKDVSAATHVELAKAVTESDFRSYSSYSVPKYENSQVFMKLQLDDSCLPRTVSVLQESLKTQRQKYDQLASMSNSPMCSTLFDLCTKDFIGKKNRLKGETAQNITKLESSLNLIDQLQGISDDKERLETFLSKNPLAAHYVMTEGKPDGPSGKRKFWYLMAMLSGVLVLLIVMYIEFTHKLLKKREKGVVTEAKHKYNREKRMEGFNITFAEDDQANGAEFGTDYTSVVRKNKRGKIYGTEAKTLKGKKNHPFVEFYSVDPAAFDFVEFVDPNTGVLVKQNALKPDINGAVEGMVKERLDQEYDRLVPYTIQARFGKENSADRVVVDMTQHNSLRLSKKNPNLPVGYPEMDGQYRQTGDPKMMSVATEGAAIARSPESFSSVEKHIVRLKIPGCGIWGFAIGRIVYTNYHLFQYKDSDEGNLELVSARGTIVVSGVNDIKVHKFEGLDLVGFELPFDAPPFATRHKARKPVDKETVVLITGEITKEGMRGKISGESIISADAEAGTFWRHYITTSLGDCGGVVVATSDRCVVGFHALKPLRAGAKWNYFVPVNDEVITHMAEPRMNNLVPWEFNVGMIDWGLKNLEQPTNFPWARMISELVGFESGCEKHFGGNLKAIASIDRPFYPKSVIRGQRQEYIQFLHLNPEFNWATTELESRLPAELTKASFMMDVLKYDKPLTVGRVHEATLKEATNKVIKLLESAGFTRGGCSTVWEASEVVNDMNWQAAMGACYEGKKGDWFEDKLYDEVVDAHEESIVRLCNGQLGVWTGSLKSELRPRAKVLAGKTRVFTAAPVDVLMGAKSFVDSFNKQFYKLHLAGPWTVGINKYCRGWDALAQSFNHNWEFIDADGSQFDSSLTPVLFSCLLRVRLHFHEHDEISEVALRNLYAQIVYTPISAIDGCIFKKHRGNNSGQPSTVVDNTLMLMIAFEYAKLMNRVNDKDLIYFANGDDLLVNGTRWALDEVQASFSKSLSDLGLNYDFGDRHADITTVEYMSHSFVWKDDLWIPKLSKGRILSILEWERNEDFDAQIGAINAALIEAWGYDDVTAVVEAFYYYFIHVKHEPNAIYFTREAREVLYTKPQTCGGEIAKELNASLAFGQEHGVVTEADNRGRGRGGFVPQGMGRGTTAPDSTGFALPAVPARFTWLPPAAIEGVNESRVAKLLSYKPQQGLVSSKVAGQDQLYSWMNHIAISNGWTTAPVPAEGAPIQFGTVGPTTTTTPTTTPPAATDPPPPVVDQTTNAQQGSIQNVYELLGPWIVWCIENGTSREMTSQAYWHAVDGAGNQVSYPMKPWVEGALPTLRSIMRNFSDIAVAYIQNRNQSERYIPRWGVEGGMTDAGYADMMFDFYVPSGATTKRQMDVHANIMAAHVGRGSKNLLTMALTGVDGEDRVEYHTRGDAGADVHHLGGAQVATRR